MKNFDTRVYSVADFLEWHNGGLLELSPDFQRRAVWSEKAKSYLIDTIIRGKPIPKILITQELQGPRAVRVVVDGQQRLRAILEYVAGAFKISRAHHPEFAGKAFDGLPEDVRRDFLKYELGVDLLFDLAYEDILDIFARLNSYTVKLNKQELLNAKYLGFYKQVAYALGFQYVRYYLDAGVLTKSAVTRMAEAELSADLLMALVGGVQTNKNIERYYKRYDDDEGPLQGAMERFDKVMSYMGEIYTASDIRNTNWSRVQLFYTLFTVVAHALYGLQGLEKANRPKLTRKKIAAARVVLDEISARYDEVAADLANPSAPKDYKGFIEQTRRGTTDTGARIGRATFVLRKLGRVLG